MKILLEILLGAMILGMGGGIVYALYSVFQAVNPDNEEKDEKPYNDGKGTWLN